MSWLARDSADVHRLGQPLLAAFHLSSTQTLGILHDCQASCIRNMDTPDDEFDFPPPAYASRTTLVTPAAQDIQCSLPRYSGSPGEFERVVAPDTSHEDTFVFKSSHIEMDMGPRKWTKRIPAYGRHAIVRGAFTVTGGWKSCRVSVSTSYAYQ